MMVSVVRRHWLAEEAREAVLWIQDGETVVEVFCHPCSFAVGDTITEPIRALDCTGIKRISDELEEGQGFALKSAGMAHTVRGVVESTDKRLLRVGSIRVQLDVPLPKDLRTGDPVEFECERLDVIR